MEKIEYTEEKMKGVQGRIRSLVDIVNELENDFPGRHFTLDGHLVGSIGEVMAAYHYGISLYRASEEIHDGEVDGKKVQIKMTQAENVNIAHEPDYLIVLYLRHDGQIYEIYNGPGKDAWENAQVLRTRRFRMIRVNKLMKLDEMIDDSQRIRTVEPIEKMKPEYKNLK